MIRPTQMQVQMPLPIPTPRSHKSRRRPMLLASALSILLVGTIFPTGTDSWTAPTPIATRKQPKPTLTKGRSFSLRMEASEDSHGHFRPTFSVSSLRPTFSLSSSSLSSSAAPSLSSSPATTGAQSSSAAQPVPSTIQEIAIVLNTNAKGVTEDLIQAARTVLVQREFQRKKTKKGSLKVRLLVTSTYEEAKAAAKEIINAANDNGNANAGVTTMVIPVGGDGTLTTMINLLWEEHRLKTTIEEHPQIENGSNLGDSSNIVQNHHHSDNNGSKKKTSNRNFPIVFGYVAMGTGNALGSVVGCLPVVPSHETERRKHRSKRRRVLRFLRKCFRPQTSKREKFGLVLSQLIEAAEQRQMTPNPVVNERLVARQDSIEIDVVELPLIRVRTHRRGMDGNGNANGTTNGLLAAHKPRENGETSTNHEENNHNDVEGYAFFAGLGYDSLLLQDYKDMQDWTKASRQGSTGFWQVATTGVVGYTVAMFTRSLPKLLKLEDAKRLLRDVKITTKDPASGYWIDHRRGDTMRPLVADSIPPTWENEEDEELLVYRGSAGIVATGTVPYYGGGLRLFPFARMTPNGMHLRIGRDIHPLEGISRIPSIFEGSFRDKSGDRFRCLDFVGNQFTVEIYESYKYNNDDENDRGDSSSSSSLNNCHDTEEGFPVQHSGESLGHCTSVEFTVSDSKGSRGDDSMPPPIRFVTLMPPRLVKERTIYGKP